MMDTNNHSMITGNDIAIILLSKCNICNSYISNCAIVPCGHIAGCKRCIENKAVTKCPCCIENKISTQKVYQSGYNEFNDNSQLSKKHEYKCVICLVDESNIALKPCGHICICNHCIKVSAVRACPICRTMINSILQICKLPAKPTKSRSLNAKTNKKTDKNPPPRGECIIL